MKKLLFFIISFVFLSSCLSQKKKEQIQKSDDHHKIAIGLLKVCDTRRALSHLIKAIKFDPKNFIVRHTLASTYYVMEDYEKASLQYLKSLKLEPNFTEARVSLAGAYIHLNELDKALEQINIAEQDQTYTGFLKRITYKAWLYYEKKDYVNAKKEMEEALSLPKGKTCFNYIKMGQIEMNLGNNLKQAEQMLKKAVVLCGRLAKQNLCVKHDFEELYSLALLHRTRFLLSSKSQADKNRAKYYFKIFLNKVKRGKRAVKARKYLKELK